MKKRNIIYNHTIEEYNKKYRNRNYALIKCSKKQVEDFDKKYGYYTFNNKDHSLNYHYYLLKDRKWWFINDTFYEVPKPPRFTWFRNLNIAVQSGLCLLGAGVIASAITIPLVLLKDSSSPEQPEEKIIDVDVDYDEVWDYYYTNKLEFVKGKKYNLNINLDDEHGINYFAVEKDDGIGAVNFSDYCLENSIELKHNGSLLEFKVETPEEYEVNYLRIYKDGQFIENNPIKDGKLTLTFTSKKTETFYFYATTWIED